MVPVIERLKKPIFEEEEKPTMVQYIASKNYSPDQLKASSTQVEFKPSQHIRYDLSPTHLETSPETQETLSYINKRIQKYEGRLYKKETRRKPYGREESKKED